MRALRLTVMNYLHMLKIREVALVQHVLFLPLNFRFLVQHLTVGCWIV